VLDRVAPAPVRRPGRDDREGREGRDDRDGRRRRERRSARHSTRRPAPRRSPAWLRGVGIGTTAAVLVLAALTWDQPLGPATSRHRPPRTELSFPDPAAATRVRDGRLPLAFRVHNAQGRAVAYPYTVVLDGRTVLRGRTPTVPDGGDWTERRVLTLPPGRGRAEVRVELAGGPWIHRWVDRAGR
jgi:hypothetical protein